MKHRIAHVDANAFYCSCERVFRPDLAHTPLVVLSNGDGCVIARDAQVKQLGVPMGKAWFELKGFAKRHGIVAFSSNYTLYGDMSRRVMDVLAQFSPDIEIYSIDEAFVDLTHLPYLPGLATAHAMRERVALWTGLPVGVGIGATKTQAKLADWMAKHDPALGGVCDLTAMAPDERARRLRNIDVGEVWGIGGRLSERLHERGLHTIADLMATSARRLRTGFGVVLERAVRELQGEACLTLETAPPPRQQIIASRTFSAPVYTPDELAESIRQYMACASAKLRAQGSIAGALGVWIETNRFRTWETPHHGSATINLPQATNDTGLLTHVAVALAKRLFRPGCRYWKSGVMLLDLRPAGHEQWALFNAATPAHTARRQAAMQTMDAINAKWGRGTLGMGSAGLLQPRDWAMQRHLLSPRYTTCWDELVRARA